MDYIKEKQEAIEAGEQALRSLTEARDLLSTARSLGIWDILGGGSLVSLFKHYKVDKARSAIEDAKYDLRRFCRELEDVQMDLDINIGGFLTAFDLMDSFLADILVQSRIRDASQKIDDAIMKVRDCLDRLRRL